jgi:hypothetical protein
MVQAKWRVAWGLALCLSAACSESESKKEQEPPATPALERGWQKIAPGGATTCARGDDFHFFVRGGSVNKLAIVFDGGGACWDARTCGIADAIFSPTADEMLPEPGQGLGALDNPENPIRDWYAVFIPYCTGDLHWGDNEATYPSASGGEDVVIRHRGQVNVRAVLDWVYANFEKPETILVTGISAGAYGSIGWAPYVMQHYPDSFVVQLGDCGAGVITDTFFKDSFPSWKAESLILGWMADADDVSIEELQLEDLYIRAANAFRGNVFSQYNTYNDENQRFYYTAMGGADADWSPAMREKLAAIHAGAPTFRSYVAGGELHGILPYDEFYSYQADGVRLRDWFADLIEGKDVENVSCVSCDEPELYTP